MMDFCEHRRFPVQTFGILVKPPPPDLPVVHVSCLQGMHNFRFSDVMSYYSDVTMHLVLGKHVGNCLSILNEMIVVKKSISLLFIGDERLISTSLQHGADITVFPRVYLYVLSPFPLKDYRAFQYAIKHYVVFK